MAKKLALSLKEYNEMVEEANPITMSSLNDALDDDGDDKSLKKVDVLADKKAEDPTAALNQRDVLDFVTRSLTEKERLIVIMYYYEGLTMKEIGDVLDLTESRICQIHSSVLGRLRKQLKKNKVKSLLYGGPL
jgi:RNA polymerase sigma factor for flagellar operon FliA